MRLSSVTMMKSYESQIGNFKLYFDAWDEEEKKAVLSKSTLNKFLKISNKYTATLLDLYNHNPMKHLYQELQDSVGGVQLRRRFETVSVDIFIEVKRYTYNPPRLL